MIRLVDVHKSFGTSAALNGVSLDITRGEIFGVIGQSGAGKSTLIRLVNALERPTSGHIWVEGVDVGTLRAGDLRTLRRRIGMIFQDFGLLSSQTVSDNVALPLKLAGMATSDRQRKVAALLDRVGLSAHADHYPSQLSGGQKQRVGIARALATNPAVLLCDEATSALDPETTRSVLALLHDLNRELKLTIMLITHEMDVVHALCDRVAVLDQGGIVETGAVADIFADARHPATQRMLRTLSQRTPGR